MDLNSPFPQPSLLPRPSSAPSPLPAAPERGRGSERRLRPACPLLFLVLPPLERENSQYSGATWCDCHGRRSSMNFPG